MKQINLADAPADVELEIMVIDAGVFARKRLISMGLHPGDKLVKLNNSTWGPILLRNVTLDSSKIAIGRRLANKISVGYEES